jgi:cobalt/nickel transport system permease protein
MLIFLTPIGLLAGGTYWGEWNLGNISGILSKNNVFRFNFKSIFHGYALSGTPEIVGYILSAALGVAVLIIIFKIFTRDAVN